MKALIFAAGMGTRLRPVTDTIPKALVPVCGKPLLWHVMMKLKSAGITEVVVNVHHFADMVEDYLKSAGDLGMTVHISDERDLLRETGGGIMHARKYLQPSGDGEDSGRARHFLVHNVDILSDLDIGWFESQVRPDAMATLLVSRRRTSRYLLFDSCMRLAGWTNEATGEVRSPYPDLDVSSCRKLAFSGIHIISTSVFPVFIQEGFGERFPIMDFYLKAAAKYPVYGVLAEGLHLIDVGKPEALEEAGRFVLSRMGDDAFRDS